jgi:anaerobic magnesium-protoporphyrin IX monomethyl ester cyclase
MRILCLYSSLLSGWSSYRPHGNSESSFNDHSLMMLSAVLKKAGHECFSMDLRSFNSWEHFESVLKEQSFDLTLVSFYSANEKFARQAVEIVKKNFPDKYIIGGGVHLSVTKTQEYPNIDSIVWGEGEPHIINIINTIQSGKAPEKIYELEMIKDMDSLPYMDRELFNSKIEESSPLLPGLPEPFITITAGRGCPYHCIYCFPSRNLINGDKCRIRSVDHFLGELIEINKVQKIGSIMIHDDLLGTKKWVEELIEKWNKHLPRIPFWCQLRADVILRIKDYIPALNDIGLSYVSVGFESASDRELKFIRKGITAEQNYEAANLLHENNINLFANVILGLPLQEDEDRKATSKFMEQIKPAYPAISVYTSYPGSDLYNWIKENDYWVGDGSLPEHHYSMHRYPFERKIKGIDYDEINRIINKWNMECKGELRNYVERPKFNFLTNKMKKNKKPKVSVIILTYNRPKMLKAAVQSIFDQTLTDWEMIIIENGGDWEMNMEVYDKCLKDHRVKWLRRRKNINNISFNWNQALDGIEGEYWCTLDDDNTKYPEFLEKMADYLDNNMDKDAVVCPMEHTGNMHGVFYRKPASFNHIRSFNHIDSGQIMYRKSIIEKIGMFDEKLVMLEDWDYVIRAYALDNETGNKIGWLDNNNYPLCSYSWHDSKRMFSSEIKPQEDHFTNIVWNKPIYNMVSIKFFTPKENMTESQMQLANNIKEAVGSLPFVQLTPNIADFILILGTLYNLSEVEMQELRKNNQNSKIIALLCEDPQALTMNMRHYGYIDRIVTNDINAYEYYMKNMSDDQKPKFMYWNNLSISNTLKSFMLNYNPKKEYDYCIIGHAYPSRIKFAKELQKHIPDNKKALFIGNGWKDEKDIKGKVFDTLPEIQAAKEAMKSKVVIIKHRDDSDLGGFPLITPKSLQRGYIEAGYRAVLIADLSQRDFHAFEPGTLLSYSTPKECANQVNKVLDNYKNYKDHINNLFDFAMENFTHYKRLLEVLNCVRSQRFNHLVL